jgi:hypothetical protein
VCSSLVASGMMQNSLLRPFQLRQETENGSYITTEFIGVPVVLAAHHTSSLYFNLYVKLQLALRVLLKLEHVGIFGGDR